MKTRLGTSGEIPMPPIKRGYSTWIEQGVWFTSRTVNKRRFGGHAYDDGGFLKGIRDCPCGCHMSESSSSGPVDPFGACPSNPKNGIGHVNVQPSYMARQYVASKGSAREGKE